MRVCEFGSVQWSVTWLRCVAAGPHPAVHTKPCSYTRCVSNGCDLLGADEYFNAYFYCTRRLICLHLRHMVGWSLRLIYNDDIRVVSTSFADRLTLSI